MSKLEEIKELEAKQKIGHVTAAQLRRKLDGESITKDDVLQAHEYAKMFPNAENIALYTSIKRQAQDNEQQQQ